MPLQEEFENQGIWLFRYRGTLPVLIFFIGLGLFLKSEYLNEDLLFYNSEYEFHYELFCLLISFIGLAIRIYTVGHTPKNTSGRNVKKQVADTLNSTGIYSVVRHPLYLGNFFMWLGAALLTGNLWFVFVFCLFYWVYYERIMFAEEQFLRGKFKDTYINWAKDVPAFIPKLSQFKKSDLPFSWKKILKKEKNGFAAIFIIFAIFDIGGEAISGDYDYNYYFIYAAGFSILLYLILRYMKRNSKILEESGR